MDDFKIGLDATDFRSALVSAAADAQKGGQAIGRGLNSATEHSENLLRSNHRVARQIEGFSKTLISGGSAAEVFATGLEGVGRSMNLSLGALAGLGLGAMLIKQLYDAHKESVKLRAEIDKIAKSGGDYRFTTLDALEKRLEEVTKKAEEAKKGFMEKSFGQKLDYIFTHAAPGAGAHDDEQTEQDDKAVEVSEEALLNKQREAYLISTMKGESKEYMDAQVRYNEAYGKLLEKSKTFSKDAIYELTQIENQKFRDDVRRIKDKYDAERAAATQAKQDEADKQKKASEDFAKSQHDEAVKLGKEFASQKFDQLSDEDKILAYQKEYARMQAGIVAERKSADRGSDAWWIRVLQMANRELEIQKEIKKLQGKSNTSGGGSSQPAPAGKSDADMISDYDRTSDGRKIYNERMKKLHDQHALNTQKYRASQGIDNIANARGGDKSAEQQVQTIQAANLTVTGTFTIPSK